MRALFALVIGLVAAAIAGTATFLVLSGDVGIARAPMMLWSLPVIGAIATAPGWIVALLATLPVVTHLAGRKPVAPGFYYGVAIIAGGVSPLASPLGILLVSEGEAPLALLVLLACGSIAGLCFAAVWHFIILNNVAARRDHRTGTLHG